MKEGDAMEKTLKQIESDLTEQLKLKGIDTSYYLNQVDTYIKNLEIIRSCQNDISENGVMVDYVMSNGKMGRKKNECVRMMLDVQKQNNDILRLLDINPDSIVSEDDVDEL